MAKKFLEIGLKNGKTFAKLDYTDGNILSDVMDGEKEFITCRIWTNAMFIRIRTSEIAYIKDTE